MSLGPLVAAAGLAALTRVGSHGGYVSTILPGVLILGAGLTLTVAPLTSTVLAAGGEERAGISAAINNAVARVAGLVMVAIIPTLAGIGGAAGAGGLSFDHGFRRGLWIAAGVCAAGGALAALTIRGSREHPRATRSRRPTTNCPVDGPPLRAHTS